MKKTAVSVICLIFILQGISYSQTPPPSQTGGGIEQQQDQIQRERALQKRITTEKKKEEGITEEKAASAEGGKPVLITKIEVEDVTLIPKDVIDKIISSYEGKELSLREMQKACDLITDEYRKRGRVTSRAYLPPQTIRGGILVIAIVEGKVGNVEVRGNRYFGSQLIKKKLKLKPGKHLDYQAMQKGLTKLNENPDRFVKLVLIPGREAGTTDIVLEVEDKLPFHYGYEFDNFGSRYIEHDRHTGTVEHNNLLGLDDKLSFKYQKGQGNFYDLYSFQYTVPATNTLDIGAYTLWSDTRLAKEFKAQNITGSAQLAGAFLNFVIINLSSVDLGLTGGFDYKSVLNYVNGNKNSRDEDRVIKVGFDLDMQDRWGRTIVTFEEDIGLLIGNLHKKDPLATRQGAGAVFNKLVGNLYRLQPMPFGSTILWKNQFQATAYNMLAIEQLQVGGIANVRGYSPGEYSGDSGLTSTVEWAFPPYFMPKNLRVPLSKSTFYDATRFVAFYDLGYLHTKTIQFAGDKTNRTVQGWGGGVRFNLPEELYARIEFAYRFNSDVQFGDANMYMDFSKRF